MDLISNSKLCLFLSLLHMTKSFKNTHIKLKIWHFMFKQVCRQILFALENQSCTFYCAILLVWSLIK